MRYFHIFKNYCKISVAIRNYDPGITAYSSRGSDFKRKVSHILRILYGNYKRTISFKLAIC